MNTPDFGPTLPVVTFQNLQVSEKSEKTDIPAIRADGKLGTLSVKVLAISSKRPEGKRIIAFFKFLRDWFQSAYYLRLEENGQTQTVRVKFLVSKQDKKQIGKERDITDLMRQLLGFDSFTSVHERINQAEKQIQQMIATSSLNLSRKQKLQKVAETFKQDLVNSPKNSLPQVYIMEGATVPQGEEMRGRISTDPDENIALKTIAQLTKLLGQTSVIALPDPDNVENTKKFLGKLGIEAVEVTEKTQNLKPDTIYLVSTKEEKDVSCLLSLMGDHDISVLGPPLGKAHLLLDKAKQIEVMGEIKEADGKRVGISTNTKEVGSKEFIQKLQAWNQTSSQSMQKANATVSFADYRGLNKKNDLFTKGDTRHWLANTSQQFSTAFPPSMKTPGSLLAKRLEYSGVLSSLYGKEAEKKILSSMKQERPKALGFQLFLEALDQPEVQTTTPLDQLTKLGVGKSYWTTEEAAKQALSEATEFFMRLEPQENWEQSWLDGLEYCKTRISEMSMAQAQGALAALYSAYKNIYDEKTDGGWEAATANNGNPLDFAKYSKAYEEQGKQIPYDALVVLFKALGKDIEHPNLVDQILLLTAL